MDQTPTPEPIALKALVGAGLTDAEARLYLALLEMGSSTISAVASRAGLSRQASYAITERLESLGLAIKRPGGVVHIDPVSPDVAINRLIEERRRQMDEAAEAVPALQERFGNSTGRDDPNRFLEVLKNDSVTLEHLTEAYARAEDEILVITRPPFSAAPPGQPLEAGPISRGVSVRTVYPFSVLEAEDSEPFARFIQASLEMGEEARFHPDPPAKVVLIDGREILLTLEDPMTLEPAFTSIFLKHRRLGMALRRLFEITWQEGLPLEEAVKLIRPDTPFTLSTQSTPRGGSGY